jgi:hypothetical protein
LIAFFAAVVDFGRSVDGLGKPMKIFIRGMWLILFFLPAFAVSSAQSSESPVSDVNATFEDSATGLQQQFQDFLRIIRSGDQEAVKSFLDSFAIPDSTSWFTVHFEPSLASQLTADYAEAFAGARSHIWWATGNFAQFDDFSYFVNPSELPGPISDVGFESLLPRPTDQLKIENFRISSASSDSKHGPPSWVSSFIYLGDRFRWVGGTYPFWAEGLSALRGPMSLPPATLRGRTVQAIAFRNDQKTPGIDGIVQLEIKVERDGHVSKIKVLSGDAEFIEDAENYIKAAHFPAMPNDPRLANAERKWPIVVAFFTPKTN